MSRGPRHLPRRPPAGHLPRQPPRQPHHPHDPSSEPHLPLRAQPEGRTPDLGRGLITAVVQDATTREVLMVAHMDYDAYEATLATGRATFWSRSRQRRWRRGRRAATPCTSSRRGWTATVTPCSCWSSRPARPATPGLPPASPRHLPTPPPSEGTASGDPRSASGPADPTAPDDRGDRPHRRLPPHRRLRSDRRLQERRAGRGRRQHRLVLPAPLQLTLGLRPDPRRAPGRLLAAAPARAVSLPPALRRPHQRAAHDLLDAHRDGPAERLHAHRRGHRRPSRASSPASAGGADRGLPRRHGGDGAPSRATSRLRPLTGWLQRRGAALPRGRGGPPPLRRLDH